MARGNKYEGRNRNVCKRLSRRSSRVTDRLPVSRPPRAGGGKAVSTQTFDSTCQPPNGAHFSAFQLIFIRAKS